MRIWFLLGCLLLLQSSTALAQQHNSDWRFTLLFPMIWAPDIRGEIRVEDDKYTVTIPFDEKIKDLDTGLIGGRKLPGCNPGPQLDRQSH